VTDFITNPRKALRLPLRCGAVIHGDEGTVHCATVDVSLLGCHLVTSLALAVGERVWLRLTEPRLRHDLSVGGTVVWAGQEPGGHAGVRFDEGAQPQVERWLDTIAGEQLDLLHHERVPDRIELGVRLYPVSPPELPPELGDEESVVLRLVCRQPTVGDLQIRLGADWSRAQRALFSLLTRGLVTLDPGEAGGASGWLERLEPRRPVWDGEPSA
jgi:hypothetical protein